MSDPIGPGDWVEKVEGLDGPHTFRGQIYRAEAVSPARRQCQKCEGCVGLKLGGQPRHLWFSGCCYSPIYRRRDAKSLTAKLLEGALSGVPAQVVRERSRETIKAEPDQ